MKEKKHVIILIIIIVIIVCSKINHNKYLETINKNTSQVSYSINVNKDGDYLYINNNEINVDITINNGDNDCSIGVFIFANGIAQRYYTSDNDSLSYIIPYHIKANNEKKITLNFTPTIENITGDISIVFGSMVNPNVKLLKDTNNIGFNQNIFFLSPYKVINNDNLCLNKNKQLTIDYSFYNQPINKDIIDEYSKTDKDGNTINYLDENVILSTNEENHIVIKDKRIYGDLYLYGGESAEYVISAYINNDLASVFNDNYYSEVSTNKDNYTVIKIDCDISKYNLNRYNTLYFIAIPVNGNTNLSGYKSDSIIFKK